MDNKFPGKDITQEDLKQNSHSLPRIIRKK